MGRKTTADSIGRKAAKSLVGRRRRRWVDNIKMDVGVIGWGGVDWIGLAQDRDKWSGLVNAVMKLRVLLNAGKVLNGNRTGGVSSIAQLHGVSYLPTRDIP
jgi:hypothetical protein